MSTRTTVDVIVPLKREHLRWAIEEAHCAHWLSSYNTRYTKAGGLTVQLNKDAMKSGYDIKPKNERVKVEQIAEALGNLLSDARKEGSKAAAEFMVGEADGPMKDKILQFAVFGKVVYA